MEAMLTKREAAVQLLASMFANNKRISIADAVAAGRRQGISRRTLARGCKEMGGREVHNGPYSGFWELTGGDDIHG